MADGQQQWATGVLRGLGITPTARSVSNLIGWANAEGGHTHNDARYNYLNTTQPMPGAGNTGSQGNIKVYKSLQQGIQATVKTLRNGRYGSIIHALSGSPQQLAQAIDSSPWGTHNPNLASIIASGSGSPTSYSSAAKTSSAPSSSAPAAAAPVDDSARQQALLNYVQQRNSPNALLTLASGLQQAGAATSTTPSYGNTAAPSTGTTLRPSSGSGGATAAVSWIQSKVGDPSSRETGTNSGGLASYANKRFGMSGAPWCAMFTSLAVTKGGAPKVARTPSVAEVRRQTTQGGGGYEKGFVKTPRPGDLILWGNNHIAMVESVKGNQVTYIGGNQSDNVTRRTTSIGDGDYVRPKYAR